jgi:hypothetical protein
MYILAIITVMVCDYGITVEDGGRVVVGWWIGERVQECA